MSVADAVARVTERVAAAARRSGRDPTAVRIVAVTKGVALGLVEQALEAGITDLGENRAEELGPRADALPAHVRWHFIGSMQRRKVAGLDRVLLIHSLHRAQEADTLNRRALELDRTFDALIQVDIAREQAKQGIASDAVDAFLERLALYPEVKPRGFMFMAPAAEKPEDVRYVFAAGRELRERFAGFGLEELSMGMSDDFEVAVEEGATIVRIGRAIFRPEED